MTSSALVALADAELVALARGGDQAAYGQLVSRHQTLIVSLAYGICGDFARSQDLAQEAFVAAWRQLRELEEPAKFKNWLCGIVRNLGHSFIRRQLRRSDNLPIPPESVVEPAAEAPSPRDQTVTREESTLVWRALEQLPETYREPLILFYREHHSVARVAAALDLTEDVAKQRLARGRAMLREQMESVIERSLGRTTPGVLFTTSVLAALPVTAAQVAGGTLAAAKGGAGLKASGFALLTTTLFAVPILNIGLSIFVGRQLLRHSRSDDERRLLRRLWWIESVATNLALLAIFATSAWSISHGPLPFSLATQTLVSLAVVAVIVLVPVGLSFRYRNQLLDYARNVEPPETASRWQRKISFRPRRALIYRSKLTLGGLPLLDIRFGHSREEPLIRGKAVGWIALGDIAHGVLFAGGGFAVGGIAIGGIAVGALSAGWITGGLVTAGFIAVGGLANGVMIAVGHLALGSGISIGWDAAAGLVAIARHIASGGIAFAESTQYAVVHDWPETNPIVQTFRLPLALQIVAPGVVNALAALLGCTAFVRHPRPPASATAASQSRTRFGSRAAFLGFLGIAVAALAWSFDVAVQHTKRRMAAETETAIARARDAIALAPDEDAKAKARAALGRALVAAHRFDAALAEFLWLLDHGAPRTREDLLSDLYLLSGHYPPAKNALLERRARAEAAIFAGQATREAVGDVVALNYTLHDEARSLEFYDRLPAANPLRPVLARRLFAQFLAARRYAESLEAEPPDRIFQMWSVMQASTLRREKAETLPFVRKTMREHDVRWVADRIEALAGAGALDDARVLLAHAREFDDSPGARAVYRTSLERGGHLKLLAPETAATAPKH
jgi:RNA polymerase sigma factor (sigma-70 family)